MTAETAARKEPATDKTQEPGPSMLEASAWRDMLAYLRPYRGMVAGGTILTLIGSLIGLTQPVMAKWIVDALERHETVVGPLVLLTGAVVIGSALGAVGYYVLGRIAESVVLSQRHIIIRRILRLQIPETARVQPGDLMSRATVDTLMLREAVSQTVIDALKGVIMLAVIVVMMWLMDPVLLLVTLGVLIVAAVLIGLVVPYFQRYSKKVQEGVGEMNTILERVLGAFRTIKASGSEPQEAMKLDRAANQAWRYGLRLARLGGVVSAGALLAVHLSFLVVLGVGGARVASGAIPIGTLIAFLLYLFSLIEPLAGLITAASTFSAGVAAVRRIRDVNNLRIEPLAEPEILNPRDENAVAPLVKRHTGTRTPASVAFRDVIFSYPGANTQTVLHGVSFELPPRGMTAVVGPSGAGKSTLFSLIERFYEPDSGQILVDGKDIAKWPLAELRSIIGYVEQDAPVLAGTLRENLMIGIPDASDDEIDEVLRRTRLTGVVGRLPQGIDSQVGHRGSSLSGGERQRIAIARALLRKPRLLLLDEATSQLDAVNEAALRAVATEVAADYTVLVVAHRLSTVTSADRILVMEAGRVRAIGSHAELVATDDLYRELAATQLLVPEDQGELDQTTYLTT
jgi:ABC-type multidrug transport system fused ATPase/permease subunit